MVFNISLLEQAVLRAIALSQKKGLSFDNIVHLVSTWNKRERAKIFVLLVQMHHKKLIHLRNFNFSQIMINPRKQIIFEDPCIGYCEKFADLIPENGIKMSILGIKFFELTGAKLFDVTNRMYELHGPPVTHQIIEFLSIEARVMINVLNKLCFLRMSGIKRCNKIYNMNKIVETINKMEKNIYTKKEFYKLISCGRKTRKFNSMYPAIIEWLDEIRIVNCPPGAKNVMIMSR